MDGVEEMRGAGVRCTQTVPGCADEYVVADDGDGRAEQIAGCRVRLPKRPDQAARLPVEEVDRTGGDAAGVVERRADEDVVRHCRHRRAELVVRSDRARG